MAKTLTLRNVPDPVVSELRGRARRNGTSMQKELLSVVTQATIDRRSLEDQLAALRSVLKKRVPLKKIHAAIDEGRP